MFTFLFLFSWDRNFWGARTKVEKQKGENSEQDGSGGAAGAAGGSSEQVARGRQVGGSGSSCAELLVTGGQVRGGEAAERGGR